MRKRLKKYSGGQGCGKALVIKERGRIRKKSSWSRKEKYKVFKWLIRILNNGKYFWSWTRMEKVNKIFGGGQGWKAKKTKKYQ